MEDHQGGRGFDSWKLDRQSIARIKGTNPNQHHTQRPQIEPEFSHVTRLFPLQGFENNLVWKMEKEGWDGREGEDDIQWTFAGALFYSIVVITTIGKFQLLKFLY